jgi:Ni,Fe-hydrogenase I large subunit
MSKDSSDYVIDSLNDIKSDIKAVENKVGDVDKGLTAIKVAFEHHIRQDELMYEEFKRMNDVLQENTESLKIHMKRTALLEEAVIKMNSRLEPIELEKIKKQAISHWLKEKGVLLAKIAGMLGAMGGAIIALEPYISRLFR